MALTGLLWLCSCATSEIRETPSPRTLPPEDLVCDQDSDCGIVSTSSVDSCRPDPPVEPYAISHAAAHRHRTELICKDKDPMDRLLGGCHTDPEDWLAVCSSHLCKRRKVHFFSSPEVHCPH
jgi:hypothetical protein